MDLCEAQDSSPQEGVGVPALTGWDRPFPCSPTQGMGTAWVRVSPTKGLCWRTDLALAL